MFIIVYCELNTYKENRNTNFKGVYINTFNTFRKIDFNKEP